MIELVLCALFCASPAEAEALRATAPTYLTAESAAAHVFHARVAAALTGTDPALLLAIAWHESNYRVDYVQREPGGEAHDTHRRLRVRYSCGVMTPTPNERCRPEDLVIGGGYLTGARHLREWMDLRPRGLYGALVGVAGAGWRARRFARDMLVRSARIRRALRWN
jgi:hypothetical protein